MKYTIKKGRHYSNFTLSRLWPFSKRTQEGKLAFSKSCSEAFVDSPGWNKVAGISSVRIHQNSVRLVYQPGGHGRIRIALYAYINGVRYIIEMPIIYDLTTYDYKISVDKNGLFEVAIGWCGASVQG